MLNDISKSTIKRKKNNDILVIKNIILKLIDQSAANFSKRLVFWSLCVSYLDVFATSILAV